VKDDPKRDAMRTASEVLGLGLNIVVAAFLFGFLGHWVGNKIGARDVLTLLGGLIGAAAGFYSLYLHILVRPREDREKKKPE